MMKPPRTLQDHLESAGAVLRERPSVLDRLMAEIRQSVNHRNPGNTDSNDQTSRLKSRDGDA